MCRDGKCSSSGFKQISLSDSKSYRFIWSEYCALKERDRVLVSGEGESGNELGEENVDLQLS